MSSLAGRLGTVAGRTETSDVGQSLGDLRRAQPADVTLQHLLGLLSAKLELCARLPVYAWEARNEGHTERAAGLKALADVERGLCLRVLDELREHLQQYPTRDERRP